MHEDTFNMSLHTSPDQFFVTSQRVIKRTMPKIG
jgi:hypothetical protein